MLKLKSITIPKFNNKKTALSKPTALIVHFALIGAASAGIYMFVGHHQASQQQEIVDNYAKQASALIEQHAHEWQEKAKLLAQQPMLESSATKKTVIPVDGTVPPSLTYADQDLLNRTRNRATPPEISGTGAKAVVSTALAMPAGGYAIFEWPIAPLYKDLQAITPNNIEIKFSQQLNGGSNLDVLRLNSSGNDGNLTSVPLSTKGWQLSIGDNSPSSSTPLILALISFIAGCLSIIPWLLRKENPAVAANNEQLLVGDQSIDDAINSLDDPIPSAAFNPNDFSEVDLSAKPAPEQSEQGVDLITGADATDNQPGSAPANDDAKQTGSNLVLDELLLEDAEAEQKAEEARVAKEMIEFSLDDTLFPDLDFTAPVIHFPAHLFRAYDIRGSIDQLTPAFIEKIGRALGAAFRAKDQYQVVVGYDARATSSSYAKLVRQALADSGLTVIDIGLVPTPLMHFASNDYDKNGIMITASHNPGDENGLKWVIGGESPTPEDIQAIRTRIEAQDYISGIGSIRSQNFNDRYLDMLNDDVLLSQPVKISMDGMNGSMGELALQALKATGCEVSAINAMANGMFPNGAPDPSSAENLHELSNDIVISNSSIGFAFDGDGDRLAVLNSKGEMISPDVMITLFAKILLDSHPGSDVIFDVKCSRMVSSIVTAHGGRPVMVRTGNTFLRRALHDPEHNAIFAGEFAGHYFFNDDRGQGRDDALYAALRLLEWLDQNGMTLEEAINELPQRFSTPEILLPLNEIDAKTLMGQLEQESSQLNHVKLSTIDGIRLDFDTGFGIIRPSNTGANLTVRFDADSADDLHLIRATFATLLQPYDERLAALIRQ